MIVVSPHIGPEKALINALFIQPTFTCALNCNGCYVKGFEQTNVINADALGLHRSLSALDWWYFFNAINKPSGAASVNDQVTLYCNQVTIAMDELPTDSYSNTYAHMIGIIRGFFSAKLRLHWMHEARIEEPEWHATVHTLPTFFRYVRASSIQVDLKYLSEKGEPSNNLLDVLSISSIFEKDLVEFNNLKKYVNSINWNLTIDPAINIDKIKESFQAIAQAVDSIYLILHKPSTGQRLDLNAFKVHQDFIKFIKTMPEDIQKKVNIDGCVSDAQKFLDTGYGCSSNISRFQVWPDGSVSGCPYSQTRVTPGLTSLVGSPNTTLHILNNIYKASKVYEFNRCKIPAAIDPNNIKVNPRYHLEIIE